MLQRQPNCGSPRHRSSANIENTSRPSLGLRSRAIRKLRISSP
jgi:hypothetical protein